MAHGWECVLRMNERRAVTFGSRAALAAAVRRGADVRAYTTFDYGEHMDVAGSREGLVQEMMNFGVVYWLEGDRTAAIQTTRYPANCSLGFGDYPSLSFFLNNDNGESGIARPFLDGRKGTAKQADYEGQKYRVLDHHDDVTSCPCENYVYDFGEYGWFVSDTWEEVLAHEADGSVVSGSLEALREAFRAGRNLKVGVQGLCEYLAPAGAACEHEVFVELGPIYNHQDGGFLGGESQPVVRVAPGAPLRYCSGNWDFGWLLPRTDGVVHQVVVDPHTREFVRKEGRLGVRWFVR